jgi:hypothetical protein
MLKVYGIDVPVPADHVERVVVQDVVLIALADAELEVEALDPAARRAGGRTAGGWKSRWEKGACSSSCP